MFWADIDVFNFSLPITNADILYYSSYNRKALLHCDDEPCKIDFCANLGH